jgi:hypothetical protein
MKKTEGRKSRVTVPLKDLKIARSFSDGPFKLKLFRCFLLLYAH